MKKLLKKIRRILANYHKDFQEAADKCEPLVCRPGRCGLNADYLTELIKEIDKVLKKK